MTKVRFYQNNQGEILGFQTIGHAGYAKYGEDIVCAGVSALILNTINSIEEFTDDKQMIQSDESKGKIQMKLSKNHSKESQILLKSLYLGLHNIEAEHGRFLKVSIKEV